MKRSELVYREILFNAMEKQNRRLSQAYLAKTLKISLSTVNLALKPLVRMNAIKIGRMGFNVMDIKKILYCWASIRNIEKDIIYKTRIEEPIREIERLMPNDIVFTGYSGYRLKFKDVPADYSEIYVYGSENIKKRFEENNKNPNLFVLKKDGVVENYGKIATIANLFVDLWNLKEWYAKDFLKALEAKFGRFLE